MKVVVGALQGLRTVATAALCASGALCIAGAIALGTSGCEDSQFEAGVRGTVQDRLKLRGEEGVKRITSLFEARDTKIRKQLEELNLATLDWDPEVQHPLVKWRRDFNQNDEAPKVLDAEARKYPGTDLEKEIPRYITFFQSNDRFWRDPEVASLDEYWGFLTGYAQASPTGPFADDVMFDQVFIHARRQFELFKIKPENRITSVFRFWQLAFDFPSLPSEAFMPYIARLCDKDDDFRAFCRKIPFEFRHMAIMTPYYDVLIAQLDAIKEKTPNTPYLPAIEYLRARFKDDQEKLAKEFEEYPILPESMAFLPANQRLNLEIGPRGVLLGGRPLELSEDGTYALTAAKAKPLEGLLNQTLVEIRETGEPELRQGNIAVLADQQAPSGAVLKLAWAPMLLAEEQQSQLNLTSFWVGRRRFDFSNLKVANEIQLVPPKDTLTLSAAHPGGNAQCKMMGFTGERSIEMAQPAAFVHVDSNGRVTAATLPAPVAEEEGQEAPPPSGPTIGMQANAAELNWNQLSQWASDQKGPISLVVDERASWDTYLRVLGPLAFRCKDDNCEKSEPRAQPNVYIGYCGN